jgi:AraC-like DNA-binding protein
MHIKKVFRSRRQSGGVLLERLNLSRQPPGGLWRPRRCFHSFAARVGRHHTRAWSFHRYLTRLRLRAALERLPDASDLTALALELGFSSHSHFTDAFRREFRRTPSEARRDWREMSKNLEA